MEKTRIHLVMVLQHGITDSLIIQASLATSTENLKSTATTDSHMNLTSILLLKNSKMKLHGSLTLIPVSLTNQLESFSLN